ncbi:hypothetical protein ACOME3_010115 [Neoechinorhynchus agilis]
MCSGKWSCTIIQDDGPQLTPIVIAHEIAHLLGVPHIEEMPDCYENDRYLVMSEQLQANSHHFKWSGCVKNKLRNIDKEFSCLEFEQRNPKRRSALSTTATSMLHKPKSNIVPCNYSPDMQCKMMFNDVASQFCASKKRQQMICNRLYCSLGGSRHDGSSINGHSDYRSSQDRRKSTLSPYVCQSRSVGALEGTSCGNNRLCVEGRCTQVNP